jgi:hypothetical protein
MNIIELIESVGVDNTKVQFLDQCADSMNWSAKNNVTKITFGSDVGLNLADNKTNMLGVVVWLPREEAMAAAKKSRGE